MGYEYDMYALLLTTRESEGEDAQAQAQARSTEPDASAEQTFGPPPQP